MPCKWTHVCCKRFSDRIFYYSSCKRTAWTKEFRLRIPVHCCLIWWSASGQKRDDWVFRFPQIQKQSRGVLTGRWDGVSCDHPSCLSCGMNFHNQACTRKGAPPDESSHGSSSCASPQRLSHNQGERIWKAIYQCEDTYEPLIDQSVKTSFHILWKDTLGSIFCESLPC